MIGIAAANHSDHGGMPCDLRGHRAARRDRTIAFSGKADPRLVERRIQTATGGWTTGICVGAEALIQWRCPGGKWIEPDSFLPLAEEVELIVGISDLLIERVVEDLTERPASSSTLHWK